MPHQRWGDLPGTESDTESGIAAIEREQITKPRPLEISGAKLHQPVKSDTTSNILTAEQCSIDPLTLHTIQLIQHLKKLTAAQPDTSDGDSSSKVLPQIPELPDGAISDRKPGDISVKQGPSDFVLGKKKICPEIQSNVCRQLLAKGVAAVCAHAGFDTADQHVLETLVDVVNDYYKRVCNLLRVAVDREALTGSSGFIDAMERVFHEIGLGSVTNLHTFYQNRIVSYHQNLLRQCQELEEECERLKTPEQKVVVDSKIKIKEEVVSEIQFPENEVEATGEQPQTPPPLEELHGALQTLEKAGITNLKDEESMKWLPGQVPIKKEVSATSPDPDDEIINVSDSPDANLTDPEISQSISSVSLSDTMSPGLESSHSGKPPKKKKKKI